MTDASHKAEPPSGRSGEERPRPFFLDLAAEHRDPARAAACVLPVPYDRTSSWVKGSDRGPAALIHASNYVELWDIETASEPYRQGIATLPALEEGGPPEVLADLVEGRIGAILDRGQLPVMLGGEHSVTVGAVRATAARRRSRGPKWGRTTQLPRKARKKLTNLV